jgi:diguanylate cyclase (GGDEF)-like protein
MGRVRHADSFFLTDSDETGWLRRVAIFSYAILREQDPARQRALIATHLVELVDATVVRAYELDADGPRLAGQGEVALPALAERMEAELLTRAMREGKSLISTHPSLDPALAELADRCRTEQVTTHLLLVRAHEETHGAYAVHWIGRDRPLWTRRVGLYYYWDSVGFAVAAARERTRVQSEVELLRRRAFWDELTELPNAQALEQELHRNGPTHPFSVLVLDFDGMREANSAFGYKAGGDVLIRAVGQALAALARPGEFAARLYTAGDEFALLLPGADETCARTRAKEVEDALDELDVPPTYRAVYEGASVGHATRTPAQTPGQTLGHAIDAMRRRKHARTGRKPDPRIGAER